VVRIPCLRSPLAWLRSRGWTVALEATANLVAPFLVYHLAAPRLGPAGGLIAAAGPPILWSSIQLARSRRLDAISLVVLTGILLSLMAFAGGGGIRALQLRETLVSGLVGLVFLGSAAIDRPLIRVLARAGARRRSQAAAKAVAAIDGDRTFRRAMGAATLVWGFGLLASCAINVAVVLALSIGLTVLVLPLVSLAAIGLLTAWTFWFVARALRAAQARKATGPTRPRSLAPRSAPPS
jgi:hypothetical protein